MKIRIAFRWYDFWVGFYYDREKSILYVCLLPCLPIEIHFHDRQEWHYDLIVADDESSDMEWMCDCGNYIENGMHCPRCGREPPWGCPCSGCQNPDENFDDELEDYLYDADSD